VNDVDRLGAALAAMSDPTRREIVDRLVQGPARVTDIAAPFAMSLNAVSKHIKVLEKAGLIRRTRQGREYTLELDPVPLEQIARWVHRYDSFWDERLERLQTHFADRRRK